MSIHKHGKGNGKKLRKARERLNARRNDHARTLEDLRRSNSSSNPAGYRAPGSMKG